MLQSLNLAFFAFHTAWMVFLCVGWAWRRSRPWHLGAVGLTAASWFGLGYWYGWGFCLCTEWHWQVRERLGYQDPPSYTQLLIEQLTGLELSATVADALTGGVFALAAVLSVALSVRDRRRWPPSGTEGGGAEG
jgi:hypothetical protein